MFCCLPFFQNRLFASVVSHTLKAGLMAAVLTLCVAAPVTQAQAQTVITRNLPATSFRGSLVVTLPPEVTLNGNVAKLSPGCRIHGPDNMLVMSAGIVGQSLKVNYTVDSYGLIQEVWILNAAELAKYWPATSAESREHSFDAASQTWSK